VLVADHPIKYSLLDDGVVFSTRGLNPAPLETRTFNVDPKLFLAALQKQTGLPTNVTAATRQFLSNAGVDLSPPKSIYFNETRGLLLVRATSQDLDAVEKAIPGLNMTPPQIHIKARFIEVPEEEVQSLGTNLIPTGVTSVAGILTDPNFRVVIHALEQRTGTEQLAEPEVTTMSGRQTQMRATDIFTVVTNLVFQDASTNSALVPQTTEVECGPILDAVASVLPDGYTIDLKVTAKVTELSGYDKTTNATLFVNATGLKVSVPTILQSFHVRQTDAHLRLWDNQTVVLDSKISPQIQTMKMLGEQTEMGRLSQRELKLSVKSRLVVFVTATIIDPAGNRVHSDEEMPFATTGIPPQVPQ
jgi:type II secretory pathway component GspD/PulD (secretin)